MSAQGGLAPAIIQGILRKQFGQFRLCYEAGLVKNPDLRGKVAVKFEIDRTGAVATAVDAGSDMPDPEVVQCVVGVFSRVSFPPPDGGNVTVVYPILFDPA